MRRLWPQVASIIPEAEKHTGLGVVGGESVGWYSPKNP